MSTKIKINNKEKNGGDARVVAVAAAADGQGHKQMSVQSEMVSETRQNRTNIYIRPAYEIILYAWSIPFSLPRTEQPVESLGPIVDHKSHRAKGLSNLFWMRPLVIPSAPRMRLVYRIRQTSAPTISAARLRHPWPNGRDEASSANGLKNWSLLLRHGSLTHSPGCDHKCYGVGAAAATFLHRPQCRNTYLLTRRPEPV